MSGTPNDVLVTSSGATTIHTLPSSNPAGTSDTVALPFQGVTGGVPVPTSTTSLPLPAGASTAAAQASQLTQETVSATALGTPADSVWASGPGSVIALLKKIAGVGGSAVSLSDGSDVAEGSIGDSAWSGSGTATVIAALKAIYGKVAAVIGVSQSGIWTVQPGNTANTTAWKVDGSAVSQPVTGSVSSVGSANIATAQVSVSTSATLLAALRSNRNSITIINGGAVATYIGLVGVTTSTGILLAGVVGASVTIPFQGALYAIVAASTNPVSVLETY